MNELIALGAFVSEFAGEFPQLETPSDIDIASLEEGGAPFFVTLPIIPSIGAVSGNGLLYDDALAAAIEQQINQKRPGANFGHLASEQRDTAFPHPKAFWVAAKRVGETLWAKAYVPSGEARQHLRNLKAMGGRIATSIFGRGDFAEVSKGVRRLTSFALETIDFAPPERAALGYGAPVVITAEMAIDDAGMSEENTMDNAQVLEQLASVKVPPNKGWVAPQQPVQETEESVAEVIEMGTIREALGVPEGMNVVEFVSELREQVDQMRQERVDAHIAELVGSGIKLAPVRGIVTKFVRALSPKTVEEANAAYEQVVEMEEVKELLALTAKSLSGPAAVVSGKVSEAGRPKLVDTPENRQRAAAEMGINL